MVAQDYKAPAIHMGRGPGNETQKRNQLGSRICCEGSCSQVRRCRRGCLDAFGRVRAVLPEVVEQGPVFAADEHGPVWGSEIGEVGRAMRASSQMLFSALAVASSQVLTNLWSLNTFVPPKGLGPIKIYTQLRKSHIWFIPLPHFKGPLLGPGPINL